MTRKVNKNALVVVQGSYHIYIYKGLRQKGVYLPIFAPKRGTPKKHMGNLH